MGISCGPPAKRMRAVRSVDQSLDFPSRSSVVTIRMAEMICLGTAMPMDDALVVRPTPTIHEAEHQQFALNARRTPERVVNTHLVDQHP